MRFKNYLNENIEIKMPDGSIIKDKPKKNATHAIIGFGKTWHDTQKKKKPSWQILGYSKSRIHAEKNAMKWRLPHIKDETKELWFKDVQVMEI